MAQRALLALLCVLGGTGGLQQQWDAGLQSPAWRHRQSLELRERTASHAPKLAGPLKPCPRPVATPALPTPLPSQIAAMVSSVEQGLDRLFNQSGATGGVGALVYGDRVLTTRGWGATAKGGGAPDGESIFRIGSVSKVFTDLMLHRLAEEPEAGISLDTPITQLAPEYSPAWPPATPATPRGGSLRDLGSHKAGLPRYGPCQFGDCNISTEKALNRMAGWSLLFEPGGDQLAYSNTGFSLLGRLLERVNSSTKPRGEPWEQSLARIADILGMNSTSGASPSARERVATAYEQGQPVPLLELGFANPRGGMYSTANDMAKLLSFLMRTEGAARDDKAGQPLDAATVRRWVADRVKINPSNLDGSDEIFFTEWGVPWQILRGELASDPRMAGFERFNLISKDGSVPGYNAQLVFQPELKLGLFTAMSTGSGGRVGVPFFSDTLALLGLAAVPALHAYLRDQPQQPQIPPSPEDFIGQYNGSTVQLQIGRAPSGPLGDAVLYILSNTGLGLPSMAPIGWMGPRARDRFVMLPVPSDICLSIEGGDHWPLAFSRKDGAVVSVTLEGLGIWPGVLNKIS